MYEMMVNREATAFSYFLFRVRLLLPHQDHAIYAGLGTSPSDAQYATAEKNLDVRPAELPREGPYKDVPRLRGTCCLLLLQPPCHTAAGSLCCMCATFSLSAMLPVRQDQLIQSSL